jgi:hypothetical protein
MNYTINAFGIIDDFHPAEYDPFSIKRGIAQSGSAPALGAGCRGFKSLYPEKIADR